MFFLHSICVLFTQHLCSFLHSFCVLFSQHLYTIFVCPFLYTASLFYSFYHITVLYRPHFFSYNHVIPATFFSHITMLCQSHIIASSLLSNNLQILNFCGRIWLSIFTKNVVTCQRLFVASIVSP